MEIKNIEIQQVDEKYHDIIEQIISLTQSGSDQIYRGQSDEKWKIESKLFRKNRENSIDELIEIEKSNIEKFKNEISITKLSFENENVNQWNLMFQARHLEYCTRLIDWSIKPEVALWMSMDYNSENEPSKMELDSALFTIPNNTNVVFNDELQNLDPYELENNCFLHPATTVTDFINLQVGVTRPYTQGGKYFIAQNTEINKSMEEISNISQNLTKYIIPALLKPILHEAFQKRKMTWQSIFERGYNLA
jgi:hypothetical protein